MIGAIAGARRRAATVTAPPMTDDFAGTFSTVKWPGSSGSTVNTAGRLRITTTTSFPQAASGFIFNLNQYPIWVEVPTLPNVGNGGTKVRVLLEDAAFNSVYFTIERSGAAWAFFIWGSPTLTAVSGSATPAYDSTNHRWLRFRIAGANLVFEASPNNSTWTALRTVVAPTWLTTGLVRATLQSYYTGTEPTPGFAEFDNFNL